MLTPNEVSVLLEQELKGITDPDLLARIHELLVIPYPVERDWDYGRVGEKFMCWTVLEHPQSDSGIAYCPQGFGPSEPWRLVSLICQGIGMDSQWFPTLESAMRASVAWDRPNPRKLRSSLTIIVGDNRYTDLRSAANIEFGNYGG